jgi:hypothetical protein
MPIAAAPVRNVKEIEARAKDLLRRGYYQISLKHRTVARLPTGLTGREALYKEEIRRGRDEEDAWRWAYGMNESCAIDQYCRVHAMANDLSVTLDKETFAAFKRLGGRQAQ